MMGWWERLTDVLLAVAIFAAVKLLKVGLAYAVAALVLRT